MGTPFMTFANNLSKGPSLLLSQDCVAQTSRFSGRSAVFGMIRRQKAADREERGLRYMVLRSGVIVKAT